MPASPMRAGMRFRLREKIFAINLTKNESRTVYIPEGEVVDVVALRDDVGYVEVLWKDTAFFVFAAELETLGDAIPS